MTRRSPHPAILLFLPFLAAAQERSGPPPLVLTLGQAIRMALSPEGNLSLRIAEESARAAEARSRTSRAELRPEVEITGAAQNQAVNLAAFGFTAVDRSIPDFRLPDSVGPFSTLDVRIRARQTLLDIAAVQRSRALRAGIETSSQETEILRDRIAAETARTYLAVKRAESAIAVARAAVSLADAVLGEARNRREAGKALGIDVARAGSRLASEKQQLSAAEMDRARLVLDLLRLLRKDLDTAVELRDDLPAPAENPLTLDQALADALRSRPDLVAGRKRLGALQQSDRAIRSERFPTAAAYADAGSLGTGSTGPVPIYTIGVAVKLPVFDGGRRESRREETQASIRQETLRAQDLKAQMEFEIRQAMLKMKLALEQFQAAQEAVALAREEQAQALRRHGEGLGTELDLAESKANLVRAIELQATALYGWNSARVDLMDASGAIRSLTP